MSKLKLTKTASGAMPTQALVDAVNACPACQGSGNSRILGTAYSQCFQCAILRKALESLTEEVDDA